MDNRQEFISKNVGLVHACAKRFKGRGIEYDDLFQAGCMGLIKAVDGFDSSRGIKFSTYAVPAILGEMKCLFRDGGAIKIGRGLKDLSLKVNRVSSEFFKKEAREPTINELAEILKIEPTQVVQAVSANVVPISLTACENDDGPGQIDIPVDSHDEKLAETIALKQIVTKLHDKDKSIIILRFFKSLTQTQTARILGMTQVQVSRREKIILKDIRTKLIC